MTMNEATVNGEVTKAKTGVDYEATLKPRAVETPLDFAFFRPAAHKVVEWALPRGITANQLTLASIATGLVGASCLGSRSRAVRTAGGALLVAYGILDCADGQLARATKSSSRVGRILDGASDYVVGVATGVSLARTFRRKYGLIGTGLATAGLLSIVVQGTLFDHAKNRYLSFGQGYREGDDLDETLREIDALRERGGPAWEKFLLQVYVVFLKSQAMLARSDAKRPTAEGGMDPRVAAEILKKLEPVARGFAWLGPSTHVALLAAFTAADVIPVYVLLRIVVGNAAAIELSRRFARGTTKHDEASDG
jgi:hypothetical protein